MGYTYIRAFASATAGGAVQEILLHGVTNPLPKLRTRTAQRTILAVARICVVVTRVASHERLALLVPARALSARALQAVSGIAARLPVWRGRVDRAGGILARAGLLRIALASAGSANHARRGELTVFAAVLVRVIADGRAFELASRGIAAGVIAA